MAIYETRESPLKAQAAWTVEDGDLVRRSAAAEARWPLADLTRMTLTRQPNRYGPDLRLAQLRFGRRRVAFASQGWQGMGKPLDQTAGFAAFVRDLAAEAARRAPSATFLVGGRAAAPAIVYWTAALLAASVVALIASAAMAGFVAIGLDWGARLLSALILMFAAMPWLPGAASHAFDPRAVPDGLAPRG